MVHMFTGRTLCQLHLADQELHADINGDGVIDHVRLYSTDELDNTPHCTATMTSGIPPSTRVFQKHVCNKAGFKDIMTTLSGSDATLQGRHVEMAPPIMLPVSRSDGTYSKKRGQHGIMMIMTQVGTAYVAACDNVSFRQVNALQYHGCLRKRAMFWPVYLLQVQPWK